MVTPLYSIRDLALQPRKSSMFQICRISKFDDDTFRPKHFKRYSSLLTEYLIHDFRVSKTANKDATIGVVRELKDENESGGLGGELGLCCVFEARVAPDHAKIDGQLGPRTMICDVVLCLGHSYSEHFKFAYALTRGRTNVTKSVLEFIHKTFGGATIPASIAPHHLVFLAKEWTRDLDEEEEEEEERHRENRKFKRLDKLELVFTLPSSVSTDKPTDVESIHLIVEEENLRKLHRLVENTIQQQQQQIEEDSSTRDPALVSALTQHISKHLNVDLTGAGVSMIVTPTGELSNQGKVRFYWPQHLKRALLHLQEASKARAEQVE